MSRLLGIDYGSRRVGFAVSDLDDAVETYGRLFGATLEHRDAVAEQGVEAASVLVGASRIELLVPTSDDTPVGRFLAKRGPGMHHLCLEVDDILGMLAQLKEKGFRLINEEPRTGADGKKYAFIHPEATGGVLVELYEL